MSYFTVLMHKTHPATSMLGIFLKRAISLNGFDMMSFLGVIYVEANRRKIPNNIYEFYNYQIC